MLPKIYEVFGFRHYELACANGMLRCGYFQLKVYIGDDEWMTINDFKLIRNDEGFHILPPAVKSKDGKWVDIIKFSVNLKFEIAQKAAALYDTIKNNSVGVPQ